ncbi:MAG TPA: hypothetical protein VD978_12110 [Azospirillum sp.]|nr:hypothetical protein [Azospirillum sp.]
MAEIHLHGTLAVFHPEPLRLHVRTPAEAVRALLANFPGFGEVLRQGEWHVVRGHPGDGMYLDKDELTLGLGTDTALHFVPAVTGAGGGGAKAIIGAVIVVAAAIISGGTLSAPLSGLYTTAAGTVSLTGYGMVAMFGASMMLSGISQMLAPTPKMQSFEGADQNRSYLFSGPTNRVEQGGVVPVIYGRCRVGSVTVAAGIANEDVAARV